MNFYLYRINLPDPKNIHIRNTHFVHQFENDDIANKMIEKFEEECRNYISISNIELIYFNESGKNILEYIEKMVHDGVDLGMGGQVVFNIPYNSYDEISLDYMA